MPNIENEQLLKHGLALLDVNRQMRLLELQKDFHKGALMKELFSLGTGQASIELGEEETMNIKLNVRFTKSFDKDALAGKVHMDRVDLDYAGVSGLVERKRLTAADVEGFQSEGRSEFVSVRKVKRVKKGKKK